MPKQVMPQYQCYKKYGALKIKEILETPEPEVVEGFFLVVPENSEFQPFPISKEYFDKYHPQAGGYYVEDEEGHAWYETAASFESGNKLI